MGLEVDDDGKVEVTLEFDPPVSAEEMREQFQTLADRMDEAVEAKDDVARASEQRDEDDERTMRVYRGP